jgi:hypothetical protein
MKAFRRAVKSDNLAAVTQLLTKYPAYLCLEAMQILGEASAEAQNYNTIRKLFFYHYCDKLIKKENFYKYKLFFCKYRQEFSALDSDMERFTTLKFNDSNKADIDKIIRADKIIGEKILKNSLFSFITDGNDAMVAKILRYFPQTFDLNTVDEKGESLLVAVNNISDQPKKKMMRKILTHHHLFQGMSLAHLKLPKLKVCTKYSDMKTARYNTSLIRLQNIRLTESDHQIAYKNL